VIYAAQGIVGGVAWWTLTATLSPGPIRDWAVVLVWPTVIVAGTVILIRLLPAKDPRVQFRPTGDLIPVKAEGNREERMRAAIDTAITWLYRRQNWGPGLSDDAKFSEPAPYDTWVKGKYEQLDLSDMQYKPPRTIGREKGFTPPDPSDVEGLRAALERKTVELLHANDKLAEAKTRETDLRDQLSRTARRPTAADAVKAREIEKKAAVIKRGVDKQTSSKAAARSLVTAGDALVNRLQDDSPSVVRNIGLLLGQSRDSMLQEVRDWDAAVFSASETFGWNVGAGSVDALELGDSIWRHVLRGYVMDRVKVVERHE
jgi:hypothetical protein